MTEIMKSYEKKGLENMIMCRSIGSDLLKTSRQVTEGFALLVSQAVEAHPASIMLKWMTETYIDLALKNATSQPQRV